MELTYFHGQVLFWKKNTNPLLLRKPEISFKRRTTLVLDQWMIEFFWLSTYHKAG